MSADAQNRLILHRIRKGQPISKFPVESWNTLVDGLQNMEVVGGHWDMSEGKDGFRLVVGNGSTVAYRPFEVLSAKWEDDGRVIIRFWFDPSAVYIGGIELNLSGLGYTAGIQEYEAFEEEETIWLEVSPYKQNSIYTSILIGKDGEPLIYLGATPNTFAQNDRGFCVPVWRVDRKNKIISHVFQTVLYDAFTLDSVVNRGPDFTYSFEQPCTIERDEATNAIEVAGVRDDAETILFKAVQEGKSYTFKLDEESSPGIEFFMRRKQDGYAPGAYHAFCPVKVTFGAFEIDTGYNKFPDPPTDPGKYIPVYEPDPENPYPTPEWKNVDYLLPDPPTDPGQYFLMYDPASEPPSSWSNVEDLLDDFWRTDGTEDDGNTARSGRINKFTCTDFYGTSLYIDGGIQVGETSISDGSGTFQSVTTEWINVPGHGIFAPKTVQIGGDEYKILAMVVL